MPYDPNWFYSTLAQSTAAVVGLSAGFLFSWILHRRSELQSQHARFCNILQEVSSRFTGVRNKVQQKYKRACCALSEIDEHISKNEPIDPSGISDFDTFVDEPSDAGKKRSDDISEPDIKNLREFKEFSERLLESLDFNYEELAKWIFEGKQIADVINERCGVAIISNVVREESEPVGKAFCSPLEMQVGAAAKLLETPMRGYSELMDKVENLRKWIVPKRMLLLIPLVFGLVIFGMVCPMTQLSAYSEPQKLTFLCVTTFILIALLVFMCYEVYNLRNAADLSRPLI